MTGVRFLLLAFLLLANAGFAAEPVQPNIVLIVASDLGINDLGCYGREDHLTPNLDALAMQGMRFAAAYAAQPGGAPTRASLITGHAPARLHFTAPAPSRPDALSQRLSQPKTTTQLPLEEKTIAELLKAAGYVTAFGGEWQLGGVGAGAREQGFDFVFPTPTAAQATQFIETNKERPFFLFLSIEPAQLQHMEERNAERADVFNPVYASQVETLDDEVGSLLTQLDTLDLAGKTIVVFTSDCGGLHVFETPDSPATVNTPFRAGKGFLYEGGVRVPLLVRWPGKVASGALCKVPVVSTDWLPTCLALAGAPAVDGLDGADLGPLLSSGEIAARSLYWHFPHYSSQGGRPAGAIRDGDWKLIEHYEDGHAELFNLAQDPGETAGLSESQPARTAELRGKLAVWRQALGAQENTPSPRFDPNLARRLYADLDVSQLAPAATAAEVRTRLGAWHGALDAAARPNPAAPEARAVILLHARQAKTRGAALRYEAAPQKNTLGFWTKVEDTALWEFEVKPPGEYEVEILLGCGAGSGGAEVDFIFDKEALPMTVEETGHFQNFIPRVIGRIKLTTGRHMLVVKPKTKPGAAVMDLRQVMLVPPVTETPEAADSEVETPPGAPKP